MKFIRLFAQSKISIYWYRFIMTKNISISQHINFAGKFEEDDGATMLFIAEEQQKTVLNFSSNSLIVTK